MRNVLKNIGYYIALHLKFHCGISLDESNIHDKYWIVIFVQTFFQVLSNSEPYQSFTENSYQGGSQTS